MMNRSRLLLTLGAAAGALAGGSAPRRAHAGPPVLFEKNLGQATPDVQMAARGRGYALLLRAADMTLVFGRPGQVPATVRMAVPGAAANGTWCGEQATGGAVNSLVGADRTRWITGAPLFARARRRNVAPGIDLVFRDGGRTLEYDFVVRPGAAARRAALHLTGGDAILTRTGGLTLATSAGALNWRKPVAYAERAGRRTPVPCRYVLTPAGAGQTKVAFRVGRHDPRATLVIDPALEYSSLLGGSAQDEARAVATDAAGNTYVAGWTYSANLPGTTGGMQPERSAGGCQDGFVAKLTPDGAGIVYATYYGGTGTDRILGLAIDADGCAYATGVTDSPDLPTTAGALRTTGPSGATDGFVVKLSAGGSALGFGTYLGGSSDEQMNSVAIDPSGAVVVAGSTSSTDYPVTPAAFQTANRSDFLYNEYDACVTRLSAAGATLLASTYLGGAGGDSAGGVAVDSQGRIVVAGRTSSADFPAAAGALQATLKGVSDAFIARLGADCAVLSGASLLGGSGMDEATGLALAADGSIWITGSTTSADLPTTSGCLQSSNASAAPATRDAFIAHLPPDVGALLYGSYIGGSGNDTGNGVAVLTSGMAAICGATASSNLPTTADAVMPGAAGSGDAFVALLDEAGALQHATYLGGLGLDAAYAVAPAPGGDAVVAGVSQSGAFPTTPWAAQTTPAGNGDAFVARLRTRPADASLIVLPDATAWAGAKATLAAYLIREEDGAGIAYRTLTFGIDGTALAKAGPTDGDGRAALSYAIPPAEADATQAIDASFAGDGIYASSSATATLTVYAKADSLVWVPSGNANAGAPATLTAYLYRIGPAGSLRALAAATLRFSLAGTSVGSAVTNLSGRAARAVTISGAAVGPVSVAAQFAGNSTTNPSTGSRAWSIVPAGAIEASDTWGCVGKSVALTARLTRQCDGAAVAGKTLTFRVAGWTASATTDATGQAATSWLIPASEAAGVKPLTVTFVGGADLVAAGASASVRVYSRASGLTVASLSSPAGRTVDLTALLTDSSFGAPAPAVVVSFTVSGVAAGSASTDASGAARCAYAIPATAQSAGYPIGASFAGSGSEWSPAEGSGVLTVTTMATTLVAASAAGAAGDTVMLAATLTSAAGPVSGASVAFRVNGTAAGGGLTDASGKATRAYAIPAAASLGEQAITADFTGDSQYAASSGAGKLTVAARTRVAGMPASGAAGDQVTLSAYLFSGSSGYTGVGGKSLAFALDGSALGSAVTASNGIARLAWIVPDGLSIGAHTQTTAFAGDAAWAPSTSAVAFTVLAYAKTYLWTTNRTAKAGTTATLVAILYRQHPNGALAPLASKRVVFEAPGLLARTSVTTGADGSARASFTAPAGSAGAWPFTATFEADAAFAGSSATGALTIN